jgi:hypothetical protein
MTQKETDAADVTPDLLAIQSSALEAIRDYSRYLRCPVVQLGERRLPSCRVTREVTSV